MNYEFMMDAKHEERKDRIPVNTLVLVDVA